jgi:hypothetical protein
VAHPVEILCLRKIPVSEPIFLFEIMEHLGTLVSNMLNCLAGGGICRTESHVRSAPIYLITLLRSRSTHV